MSISEISINQMVYYWRRPVSIGDAMLTMEGPEARRLEVLKEQ